MKTYPVNKVFDLAGGRFKAIFVGGPENYNLRDNEVEAAPLIQNLARELGVSSVFSPNPRFTGIVASLERRAGLYSINVTLPITRTGFGADGGKVTDTNTALLFCNADCILAIVYDRKSLRWWLLHLGLECMLLPQTVLHQVVAEANPADLSMIVGFGIGTCCYGFHQNSDPLIRAMGRFPNVANGKKVEKGPRQGQVAVDLLHAATELAADCGITRVEHISTCTACYSPNGNGRIFHSHTYNEDGPLGKRNALMVRRVRL